MAGNPSDITNLLNEALAASNKIASSQLESIKNTNEVQTKLTDKSKKLVKTLRTSIDQLDLFREKTEEKKQTNKKDNTIQSFLKSTTLSIEKAAKSKVVKETIKKPKIKNPSLEKVSITNSNLTVRGNLIINSKNFKFPIDISSKEKQSGQDFYRTDDASNYFGDEIELLKSIENKLNFSGGSGASLFDSLFAGIGSLSKMFAGAAEAGVGGVVGGMFGLSKFKKLGSLFKPLSKLKPSTLLKDSGKLLKNPKLLIGLALAGAGYTIYDSIKAGLFTKDFDEVGNAEPREKGGSVISGKPYIVGEKGPELFTPRETGRIIPNNKLISHNEKYGNDDKIFDSVLELIKDQNKMVTNRFNYFSDSFEKVLEFFKPKNLIAMIKRGIGNLIDLAKDKIAPAITVVKETASMIFNKGADVANKGLSFLGLNNILQIPKVQEPPKEAPGPARRIGDKNVPRDMKVSLHKNEMVIPAAQSEALRAISKLQNQPVSYSQTPQYVSRNQLGKEFWLDEFVPKFASMIKTEKTSENIMSYNIGNVFGVG